MLDWWDIVLRLGVATAASGIIGLNRDLHGKPIGLRTLGLVGLATATVVLLANPEALEMGRLSDATSRVIQGLLTGIGFLGAGAILARGDAYFHHYGFNLPRQLGANFEMLAHGVTWLGEHGYRVPASILTNATSIATE